MVRGEATKNGRKKGMKISDFTLKIAELEGKKKAVNIGQINEIVKIANVLLGGALYKIIRGTKEADLK